MAYAANEFDQRLRSIGKKRARMANGYVSKVSKDGLIVFRPKRRSHRFPVKGMVILAIGFFIFKGMILANIGQPRFEERIAVLSQGSSVEQAGAWAMQPDPISIAIADTVRPYFK